jgi:hypothetical protein
MLLLSSVPDIKVKEHAQVLSNKTRYVMEDIQGIYW